MTFLSIIRRMFTRIKGRDVGMFANDCFNLAPLYGRACHLSESVCWGLATPIVFEIHCSMTKPIKPDD